MKKVRFIMFTTLLGLLVFGFTATDSFAQRNTVEVELTKDARKNGFKISERVQNGKRTFFLKAINVFDPKTKKPRTGLTNLLIRCSRKVPIIALTDINFDDGDSPEIPIPCDGEDLPLLPEMELKARF